MTDFFSVCKTNIVSISFYLVYKECVDLIRSSLKTHFEGVYTLPSTRSFHNFKPTTNSSGIAEARRSSEDIPTLTYNFTTVAKGDLHLWCYVKYKYDHLWYFGIVAEIIQEGDVMVKFLHSNGPSPSFFGQARRFLSCTISSCSWSC